MTRFRPAPVWLCPTRHALTGPLPLHAADPVRDGRAVCGAVLAAADLWCSADGWLTHAVKCARALGGPPPCPCADPCGGCLFWAGWPAAWSGRAA